jgi:hypothetical protein
MKTLFIRSLSPLLFLFLIACAGPNSLTNIPSPSGELSGFWSGLFHGSFFGFSFVGSLFSDNISIYAVHNTGGWYDFGFLLGASGFGISLFKSLLATSAFFLASLSSQKRY